MRTPIQLFKDSLALFRDNTVLFFSIFIIPAILSIIIPIEQFEEQAEIAMTPSTVIVPLVTIIFIVAVNILMSIALAKAVSDPKGTTVKEAYTFGMTHFLPYLWVSILVGVVLLIGFILLIIPGIIFLVWLAFATFIVLFENKRGIEALKTSKRYVEGKWFAVFGRLIFLFFISIVISLAWNFIFGIGDATAETMYGMVLTQILNFVLIPVSIAYTYFLYQDVRNNQSADAVTQESVETVSGENDSEISSQ